MPISHGHRPYEYNEFIPEMDASNLIEAVKVKQNMYDEGTQMIQAKLDQLSGLDIIKDTDREYANQELSKIYKTVQENAHSDFSNPNTVKSFLNMVKPLENDKIINNAVLSTKEFRRRQSTLDEIRKKNPALISPANVDDYMEDVQSWFDDPTQGAYLNRKEYSPYINNSDFYMKTVKSLTPQIEQQVKSEGKWMDDVTIKRLTKERVSEALRSLMSADQLNQLQIDAKFNSKRVSADDKYSSLYSAYASSINTNQQIYSDQSLSEAERQEAYKAAKADNEILQRLKQSKQDNDPSYVNQLYLNSYVNNMIDGVGQAYEYQHILHKREANPYSKAAYESSLKMNEDDNQTENNMTEKKFDAAYSGDIVLDANNNPTYDANGQLVRDYKRLSVSKSSKSDSQGTIKIGGLDKDVKDVLKDLEGSKPKDRNAIIKQILESNPDIFNTKDGIDPGTIQVDDEGNVTWEDNDMLWDDERSTSLQQIKDIITKSGTNASSETPTVTTKEDYDNLAPGDTYYYNGTLMTKQ